MTYFQHLQGDLYHTLQKREGRESRIKLRVKYRLFICTLGEGGLKSWDDEDVLPNFWGKTILKDFRTISYIFRRI